MSRIADRIESGGTGLVSRARDVLAGAGVEHGLSGLALPAVQLVDALVGALIVGGSRGACPGVSGPALPHAVGDASSSAGAKPEGLACAGAVSEIRGFGLLTLPGRPDLASAGAARRYARDTAQGWGLTADVVDDLESIVGELAANALEHSVSDPERGGSDLITVTLTLATATVTVGVTDAGPRRGIAAPVPARSLPGAEQERGRGLLITEALADRWGLRRTRDCQTVWADVVTHAGHTP